MTRRLSSPEFVGRSSELESLLRTAEAAAGGRASLVLLGGEAGVGKSRLLAEVGSRSRERSWLVLEGATISVGAEGLPFEPIVGALRSVTRQLGVEHIAALAGPSLPDLARLVPELAGAQGQAPLLITQTEWLQVRTFEGVLRLLGALGEATPVLLVIEDLHWADRSSRDLLSFLAGNARSERLLVVTSFRTDELHRRHPLVPWLAEVERQPRVERLDLRRFDRSELAGLLHGILGVPPSPALVESIAVRSDGNAFFAEELAASLDEGGTGRLPATLREIVLARLAGLSEAASRLVEVAAVAGREVDHDLLSDVAGLPQPDIMDALRESVASHLLVAVADGATERYRFRHALMQEAVYEDMLPSDRRQLHGAYARAISSEATGGPGAPDGQPAVDRSALGAVAASRMVELAHHWSAAHEQARALRATIEAGDASRSAFAFAEAAGMFERAIELWDLVPAEERPADRDLGGLFDAASTMVALVGDPGRAVDLAERAVAELDRTVARDLERRAEARERLARAAWLSGDGARSIAVLREAVALLEGAPPSIAQARVQAGLASNLMLAGRLRESQPIAERAIEIARAIGARDIASHAMSTLGVDRASLGAIQEGIDLLEASLELALAVGEPTAIGRAHTNLGTVRQMGGDLRGALEVYVAGIEASRRYGIERSFGSFLSTNAAAELLLLGRQHEAADLLARNEAIGLLPGIATIHFSITRAEVRVRTGDFEGARSDLEVAREEAASIEDVQFAGDLEGITAELALESDDPQAALVAIQEGFERVAGGLDPRVLGPLSMYGARAAADSAVTARARRDESGATAAAGIAKEMVGHYAGAIEEIDEPDALAMREMAWVEALLRAEVSRADGRDDPAAWAAVRPALAARPTPYLEAYVLWREADATPAADAGAAARALIDGHRIATAIGAVPIIRRIESLARRRRIELPPAAAAAGMAGVAAPDVAAGQEAPAGATRATPVDPFGLTTREREILGLLAEGMTNRRIAEHLFISESTAGVHVSNILGKLGVSSRTEAATLAVRLGLDREAGQRPSEPAAPVDGAGSPTGN